MLHTRQVAETLIKETVQPILDQYAMGIVQKITLETIRFGRKAPQIIGICCSDISCTVDGLAVDEE